MLSDVEIARQCNMQNITEVAKKLGLEFDDIELYGKYKAKISDEAIDRLKDKRR